MKGSDKHYIYYYAEAANSGQNHTVKHAKIFQYQCKLNVFLLFVIITQFYTVVKIVKIVRPYHCLFV